MVHKTDAIVITCIDFRIQKYINSWLKSTLRDYVYDRVALAGGVYDLYTILKQVEISTRLHRIKKVILMNHEDCGAYGNDIKPAKHRKDLHNAESIIEKLYPDLDVTCLYIHLDGTVENMSQTHPFPTMKYPYDAVASGRG
jgi:carbonic anhydrase